MTSYRFRRRAFLTALSGGIGLKIMLRNLEGSAQGMRSPGRLLITHWPMGIVAGSNEALWKPTSGSVGGSQVLQPFADHGLGPDMTVFRGLSTPVGPGGGHEAGMVSLFTGIAPGGTRSGEQESDDAYAVGPSYDQLLLQKVAALQRPGQGYANSICDSRTDFGEISAKTLSYATQFQSVGALSGSGSEAIPLKPTIGPLVQYNNLFSGFVPGTPGTGGSNGTGGGGSGGAGGSVPPSVADAMLRKLVGRRSVLDFAVEELNRVKRLAPSAARNKLAIHTDAVLSAEMALASAINAYPSADGAGGSGGGAGSGSGGTGGSADPTCVATCGSAPPMPLDTTGMADPMRGVGNSYGDPTHTTAGLATPDDAPIHQTVGQLHLSVLKAAFVCDLIRVGTFQWAPSTSHVGFALYPGTTQAYQHHPASHKISGADTTAAATLAGLNSTAIFLFNVHSWYFARHAETFAAWKNSVDGCGNNLLDFTCVPFLTEVKTINHERTNIPAMLIGGKQLGFAHNRYVTGNFTINQFWGTIAQAYGYTSTESPFAAPLPDLWVKPPT